MAMLIPSGGGRRRRARRGLSADINVTPFVDVMLVLLIVFMIAAPMLTSGVVVDLPKTKATSLPTDDDQPITVTIDKDGRFYVGSQEEAITSDQLGPMMTALAKENFEKRIFVRGDSAAAYGDITGVLALIQKAGFRNVALVTDPRSSGAAKPARKDG